MENPKKRLFCRPADRLARFAKALGNPVRIAIFDTEISTPVFTGVCRFQGTNKVLIWTK